MPLLLSVHDISKSFGAKLLFKGLSFGIETNDRIGLIGPNGAGKTTLLKILAAKMGPEEGSISYQKGLKIGLLEQVPLLPQDKTVLQVIIDGMESLRASLDDWEIDLRAEEYITKLDLNPDMLVSKLSGGWKKKVALARELSSEPDLLFLDEPTNHLDVESILWLEKFLANAPFATVTVTHDRLFLQRISNRILELDRRNVGGILSIKGSYTDYLNAKDQLMNAQERREIVLKNTLRRETEWLRRGPKARSTKQQARIDRAHELKDTVSELSDRNQVRTANIDFQKSALPKRLLEAKNVSKTYGTRTLFSHFNFLLSPGTRMGILGSNGAGKSTLIRTLLGKETSDTGEVFRSDQLAVAYFEQNRDALNPETSLVRTLCPHGDHVEYRGQQVHIKSYLDRFLFSPLQMDLAVGRLSGGEQSRILIAQLMLKPANLLVLDEPTNDLDMATLNVLQDCLTEFEGAIILVTHDRYFLDQVANKIVAFPINHSPKLEIFEDLNQWEDWYVNQPKADPKKNENSPSPAPVVMEAPTKKKKLSFKEQREFDSMEKTIHDLEAAHEGLQKEMEDPKVATNATRLMEVTQEMQKLKTEIDRLYLRWAELEKL